MSRSSKSPDQRGRRSRTVRTKHPLPLQMTEQRLQLLEALLRFRILSRDQLQRLGGYASRNTINYALGLLYHAGYIDRRYAPPVVTAPGCDHQALYLLDRKGAAVLAARRGFTDWREVDWNPKDNAISWWHLHHLVACNDVLMAFESAAQTTGCDMEWLAERELRRPVRQTRVEIQLPDGSRKRVAAVADALLVLTPSRGKKLALFLECDQGTVDISRRWPTKLLAYEATLRHPAYLQRFPIGPHTVAVATVTTSEERALHLKTAAEKVSQAGFFLFTTFAAATPDRLLTQPIWHVAHRPQRYPLLAGVSNQPTTLHAAGQP